MPHIDDQLFDLGYKNLVCGGCSFTASNLLNDQSFFLEILKNYNKIKDSHWPSLSVLEDFFSLPKVIQTECLEKGLNFNIRDYFTNYITWPYFLADRIGIDTVYNCGCPGAGNHHIFYSIMAALETINFDPADTLIVVMWTNYDRDDFLVGPDSVVGETYHYSDSVKLASSGGFASKMRNNLFSFENIKKSKTDESRTLENYLLISALAGYIKSKGFDFVFTEISEHKKEKYLDIRPYLSTQQRYNLDQLVSRFKCLGDCTQNTVDGFHPTTDEHKKWVDNIVVPFLKTTFTLENSNDPASQR